MNINSEIKVQNNQKPNIASKLQQKSDQFNLRHSESKEVAVFTEKKSPLFESLFRDSVFPALPIELKEIENLNPAMLVEIAADAEGAKLFGVLKSLVQPNSGIDISGVDKLLLETSMDAVMDKVVRSYNKMAEIESEIAEGNLHPADVRQLEDEISSQYVQMVGLLSPVYKLEEYALESGAISENVFEARIIDARVEDYLLSGGDQIIGFGVNASTGELLSPLKGDSSEVASALNIPLSDIKLAFERLGVKEKVDQFEVSSTQQSLFNNLFQSTSTKTTPADIGILSFADVKLGRFDI